MAVAAVRLTWLAADNVLSMEHAEVSLDDDGVTHVSRASHPVPDAHAVVRDYAMSADARAMIFASAAVLVEGETELGALPPWFSKSSSAQTLGDPRRHHLALYSVGGETHFKAPLTRPAPSIAGRGAARRRHNSGQ